MWPHTMTAIKAMLTTYYDALTAAEMSTDG